MPDILWPELLQQNLNTAGFSTQPAVTYIESATDVGPVKRRRRTTKGPEPLKGTIWVDRDEYDIMKSFYDEDTAGGTLQFLMDHPITGDPTYFRFNSPPVFTPVNSSGIEFSVDLDLEVQP